MLRRLTVKNLAVVEQVEVDFASGLTVITGETGAGKSVLMGALELVLGGRAEASVVRDGAKEAEVEAEFDEKTIRRTVTAQGRSRAWVDDESVSVSELKELGAGLVDIHGPTANQHLAEESFQREALDAFGGLSNNDVFLHYGEKFAEFADLTSQIDQLKSASASEDELDLLRFQANELEEAALSEEDATLGERHAAAAHAEEIVENANAVTEALGGDSSVAEILSALQPRFREMAKHWPEAAGWASEAEDLTLKVQELSRSVADAASKLDVGEEDLEELDARLTLVNRLLRKYRAPDVSGLLAVLAEKREKLGALEHREERLRELAEMCTVAEKAVRAAGAELTKRRKAAAARLAKAVTQELKDLGFLQAKFSVAIEPVEPTAHGLDRVIYLFEPNPGESARPLAQIASSGEIARVMLALKVITSRSSQSSHVAQTLVFDEIDANIGGEVGKIVGEKLRQVAKGHQVVAITHLPQSAAYGERHLVVRKGVSGGRTRTEISAVEGGDRVSELARMLGGEKLTSVVRKHAEELLQLSR